jgi:hypothetical protein
MEPFDVTYRLYAIPSLFAMGRYKGELQGIDFVAESPNRTVRWFAINCGQFEDVFADLLSPDLADKVMRALGRGLEVELPGRFRAEHFDRGFHQLPQVYSTVPDQLYASL